MNASDYIDAFQIIEGISEISVLCLKGAEAKAACNAYVKGKGVDKVCDMLESGDIVEVIEYNGELYFNVYI